MKRCTDRVGDADGDREDSIVECKCRSPESQSSQYSSVSTSQRRRATCSASRGLTGSRGRRTCRRLSPSRCRAHRRGAGRLRRRSTAPQEPRCRRAADVLPSSTVVCTAAISSSGRRSTRRRRGTGGNPSSMHSVSRRPTVASRRIRSFLCTAMARPMAASWPSAPRRQIARRVEARVGNVDLVAPAVGKVAICLMPGQDAVAEDGGLRQRDLHRRPRGDCGLE